MAITIASAKYCYLFFVILNYLYKYIMNYKKIYDSLIERGFNRTIEKPYEIHHVIPKCLGGSDDPTNLVKLTLEEHYLAHQLLVKIYPNDHRIIRAAAMMIPNRPSNKMYGWLKRKFILAQSQGQSGINNSQHGTRWVHNKSTKECKKIKGDIPFGWEEGRILVWKNVDRNKNCAYCCSKFIPIKLEKFCSNKCKMYFKSPAFKIIDDNLEQMISYFESTKSITKTLVYFGIKGKREGNQYFSKILKSRNIEVLKRRNTRSPQNIGSDVPAL